MKKICAVIPALNPDENILTVIDGLKDKGIYKIIVVNDGSKSDEYFKMLENDCDILTHFKNFGKGRAMKNALNYYMNNYSNECIGVVFADCDNQHHVDDILNCCLTLEKNPERLILGSRNFKDTSVPFKSKHGNRITSFAFKALCGLNINDTQTGLRAMGNGIIPCFLDLMGERFEYETNMLIETKKLDIPIEEVTIKTVYWANNKGSHFNPIKDSIAIYKVIFKYMWASVFSAVLDIGVFTIMVYMLAKLPENQHIFIATVSARILSSLFNFTVNHKIVFKSQNSMLLTVIKYYLLCIVQMLLSYGGVYFMTSGLNVNSVLSKLIVDTILFLLSFQVQQRWVFGKKNFF